VKINVKIVLSTVALAAVVGGSVLSYNHIYADRNEQIEVAASATPINAATPEIAEQDVVVSNEEIKAPVIDGSPFQIIDIETIDVKIPLDLADNSEQRVYSSNGNEIIKLADVRSVQHNSNSSKEVIAYYQLADGKHEVIIFQNEITFGGRKGATEATIANYNPDDVRVEEYEEYTLVIEDAELRKQVHVISESHFFTVASPGTRDLELLLDVASKIKVS
jgi:hypothetical protein